MMMYNDTLDAILLVLQAFLWGCAVYIIWGKNRLYGLFSMVLYLYLLPTEITYRFFRQFSDFYWGRDVWYEFYAFVSFSLLSLFVFLNIKQGSKKVYNVISKKRHNTRWIGWLFVSLYSIVASYFLFTNIALISYHSLVENGDEGFALNAITITDVLVRSLPAFVILPLLAQKNKTLVIHLLAFYNIVLYFSYAFITGNRSDMLSFVLSLVLLWLYGRKLMLKQIVYLAVCAIMFLYVAGAMMELRGGEAGNSLAETLLKQDYLAPAYNIVGVQAKKYVDPIAVVSSNIQKIFPALGGEWLYILVAPKIFQIDFTASQSAGFHPFTEGYMFGGFFGFIYNGIVIGSLLLLWNRFMSTNNKAFNRFMFALMGCLFFSLIRAQSINFIRFIYLDFLPAAFIYSILSNIRIHYMGFFYTRKIVQKPKYSNLNYLAN